MTTKVRTKQSQVICYPGEDGYFIAEVPSLPGCISQGKTCQTAVSLVEWVRLIDKYLINVKLKFVYPTFTNISL